MAIDYKILYNVCNKNMLTKILLHLYNSSLKKILFLNSFINISWKIILHKLILNVCKKTKKCLYSTILHNILLLIDFTYLKINVILILSLRANKKKIY